MESFFDSRPEGSKDVRFFRVKYLGDASSDEAWSVDTNSATLGLRSAGPSAPYNFGQLSRQL